MTTAYSYIRFSSERQAQGDSLRRQMEAAKEYAKEHDFTLDDSTYRDLGVSAFTGANKTEGSLKAFIETVKSGKIRKGSYLLVESLDRLSREDVFSALSLLMEIVKLDITVVTLMDEVEFNAETLSNPMNMMYSIMIMGRAHEEIATKTKRIKAAWDNKRRSTTEEKTKFTTICPSWIYWNEVKKKFELMPNRVKVLKLIFKMSLEGYGLRRIIDHLNTKDIQFWGKAVRKDLKAIEMKISHRESVTKDEKKALETAYSKGVWSNASTQRMLSYPATYGAHETPTLPLVKGYFPAIIDKVDFLKLRDMKRKKQVISGRASVKLHNIFTSGPGMVQQIPVCGLCGGTMGYIDKGRIHRYLSCLTAKSKARQAKTGTTCKYHSWQYKKVEKHILYSLREMDWAVLAGGPDRDFHGEILLKQDTLDQVNQDLDKLSNAFMNDVDLPKILIDKMKALEIQKDNLHFDISGLKDEKSLESQRVLKMDVQLVDEFYQSLTKDIDTRIKINQMIKRLVKKIVFNPVKNSELWGVITIHFIHGGIRIISILDKEQTTSFSVTNTGNITSTGMANPGFDTRIIIDGEAVFRDKVICNDYFDFITPGWVPRYENHQIHTIDGEQVVVYPDLKERFERDGEYTVVSDNKQRVGVIYGPKGKTRLVVESIPDLPPAPEDERFDPDFDDWEKYEDEEN